MFRAHWLIPLLAVLVLTGSTTTSRFSISRVEFGHPIWTDGQRRAGVLFQDGAQSFPVAGGTLWTFGDTFVGHPLPGQPPQNPQITGAQWCTVAWLPAGQTNLPPLLAYVTGTNGLAAGPLKLLPEESAKTNRLWPAGGISLGARTYLFYTKIEINTNPPPWNFRGVGSGLAVAEQPWSSFARLCPGGRWQFPVEPVQIVRDGRYLYLFEISHDPQGLILARVAAPQIEDPGAYEFLTDHGWSTNRAGVKVILREAYGQVSVVWNTTRRNYLMATSSDIFHPQEIQMRESAQLAGPWSAPVRIAVPEMPGKKTTLIYCTYLHPELSSPAASRWVLTCCRMLAGSWELSNPEWLTVTLAP